MILCEDGIGREPVSVDECTPARELIHWLFERGYKNTWLEDTDNGLVIHGVSMTEVQMGSKSFEARLVPESWNNR